MDIMLSISSPYCSNGNVAGLVEERKRKQNITKDNIYKKSHIYKKEQLTTPLFLC